MYEFLAAGFKGCVLTLTLCEYWGGCWEIQKWVRVVEQQKEGLLQRRVRPGEGEALLGCRHMG